MAIDKTLFAVLLSVMTLPLSSPAQTNAVSEFQGFHPGDIVYARVQKPLIVLNHAMFQSQTASNIVVLSKGDRYVLSKTGLVLSTPQDFAALASPAVTNGASTSTDSKGSKAQVEDAQLVMLGVQNKILGNYANQKGYREATSYYQDTMQGYLGGQVSLGDIVAKAEQTLKEVDKYQPERAADPQYEEQIRFLRDFVERAKNGETVQATSKVD